MDKSNNVAKGLVLTSGPTYEQLTATARLLETCPPEGENNPTAHIRFTATVNGEVVRSPRGVGATPRLTLRVTEIDATLPRKDVILKGTVVEEFGGGALLAGTADIGLKGTVLELRYSGLSLSAEVTEVISTP